LPPDPDIDTKLAAIEQDLQAPQRSVQLQQRPGSQQPLCPCFLPRSRAVSKNVRRSGADAENLVAGHIDATKCTTGARLG
jgi:hypothetical protein